MSNIVERLREAAANLSEIYPDYAEAADEITRLRAENKELLEALKPFATAAYSNMGGDLNHLHTICSIITLDDLRRARAALEGVTEPASPWRDIESAPRNGKNIIGCVTYKKSNGDIDYAWVADVCFERGRWASSTCDDPPPTHWMPLPNPPK